jgi:putative transposase
MRPRRDQFQNPNAAYFVSTQTARRQPFFRHERWANLLRETILHYSDAGYVLHAYVIMPDHLHLLIAPENTLEKAMQLVKGGFSFRAKKEFAWKFDIWQHGFSDRRMRDVVDWNNHLEYIRRNPERAGLVSNSTDYPYMGFLKSAFPHGLEPGVLGQAENIRAKSRTLQANYTEVGI